MNVNKSVVLVQVSIKPSPDDSVIAERELLKLQIAKVAEAFGALHIYLSKPFKLDIIFVPEKALLFCDKISSDQNFLYATYRTYEFTEVNELTFNSNLELSHQTITQIADFWHKSDSDSNDNYTLTERADALSSYSAEFHEKCLTRSDFSKSKYSGLFFQKTLNTNFNLGWRAGEMADVDLYTKMLELAFSGSDNVLQNVTTIPFIYAFSLAIEKHLINGEEDHDALKESVDPPDFEDED